MENLTRSLVGSRGFQPHPALGVPQSQASLCAGHLSDQGIQTESTIGEASRVVMIGLLRTPLRPIFLWAAPGPLLRSEGSIRSDPTLRYHYTTAPTLNQPS